MGIENRLLQRFQGKAELGETHLSDYETMSIIADDGISIPADFFTRLSFSSS